MGAAEMSLLLPMQGKYQELQTGKSESWHLENHPISLPVVAFGRGKIIESVTLNTEPLCMTH